MSKKKGRARYQKKRKDSKARKQLRGQTESIIHIDAMAHLKETAHTLSELLELSYPIISLKVTMFVEDKPFTRRFVYDRSRIHVSTP